MKKNFKFLLPLPLIFSGCASTMAALMFNWIFVSADFPRKGECELPAGSTVAVMPFQDDFQDGTVSGGVTHWMIDNFFSIIQGDGSNLIGGERGGIVKHLTSNVVDQIKEDNNLVYIDKKNAKNADYIFAGGITNFTTHVTHTTSEGKKIYQKEVNVNIRYQLIDSKNNTVLYTKDRQISKSCENEKFAPHAVGMLRSDIQNLAKEIVDITRPHNIRVDELIYTGKTKNKDFKAAWKLAKNNSLADAQMLFEKVYEADGMYEAGYDSAILLYLTGNFEKALDQMKAVQQKFDTNEVNNAIKNITAEIEYRKENF